MSSHTGKLYAITGAASGIGYATAALLAKHGALLSLSDYHEGNLQKAEEELSALTKKENLLFTVVDVRSTPKVNEWIQGTVKHFGRTIDGCANIAGTRHTKTSFVENVTDESFLEILEVNTVGVLRCLRAQVQPGILSNPASIVTVTSLLGLVGAPSESVYCASKHAVQALVKCLSKEVSRKGIRCNSVAPGYTDTPLGRLSGVEDIWAPMTSLGRAGQPSEIGEAILWLLSPESSYVTGTTLRVEGGSE